MLAPTLMPAAALLAAMRAVGEPTRLRILCLLAAAELTVKDLTAILGQSQPRISRHLKLLGEAGLVQRHPEGAWVYHRLGEEPAVRRLTDALMDVVDNDDAMLARDRERLASVKRDHAAAAARYFAANAADWDALRSLHVAEPAVEAAMLAVLGPRPFGALLDLGTGTARVLELLAPLYERGVGIDSTSDMVGMARANLDRAGIAKAQVRLGDLYHLALPRNGFDLVTLHQVLHYLADPHLALEEAARVLRPGGRLLVVDFAPHALEFLRERHAHRRLGFSHEMMAQWLEGAGLRVESVQDFAQPEESGDRLTVTLWLARDPRVEVAAGTSTAT